MYDATYLVFIGGYLEAGYCLWPSLAYRTCITSSSCRRLKEYQVPTWSWASIPLGQTGGEIDDQQLKHPSDPIQTVNFTLIQADCKLSGSNPCGAVESGTLNVTAAYLTLSLTLKTSVFEVMPSDEGFWESHATAPYGFCNYRSFGWKIHGLHVKVILDESPEDETQPRTDLEMEPFFQH